MSIDLRDCKPGDKVLSRCGETLEYIGQLCEPVVHDHIVRYEGGSCSTRAPSGHIGRNGYGLRDHDQDIVEIINRESYV